MLADAFDWFSWFYVGHVVGAPSFLGGKIMAVNPANYIKLPLHDPGLLN